MTSEQCWQEFDKWLENWNAQYNADSDFDGLDTLAMTTVYGAETEHGEADAGEADAGEADAGEATGLQVARHLSEELRDGLRDELSEAAAVQP